MGGNVFAGRTSAIKKEHIDATLEAYFAELRRIFPEKATVFTREHFVTLGSTGKKALSNDIDLGLDQALVFDADVSDSSIRDWGIDPVAVEEAAAVLLKRARTSTATQCRAKALLKLITQRINTQSEAIYADESKVSANNIFTLAAQYSDAGPLEIAVQIDWMIGDLDWLTFSYYSDAVDDTSNIKGLHRTQLMLSAFQVADLSFQHATGVKDKATGKIVAQDPGSALTQLNERLHLALDTGTVANYYTLYNTLKATLPPEQWARLVAIYFKILDSTRADIPDNLQEDWTRRRDELGLTGKFLPESSQLKRTQECLV